MTTIFTTAQMQNFLDEKFAEIRTMFDIKGNDYAHDNDAFDNFKRNADKFNDTNIDKYVVWAVYFRKHLDALDTWLNDRAVKSEPIEGRVLDLVLYLMMFWAMVEHDNRQTTDKPEQQSECSYGHKCESSVEPKSVIDALARRLGGIVAREPSIEQDDALIPLTFYQIYAQDLQQRINNDDD